MSEILARLAGRLPESLGRTYLNTVESSAVTGLDPTESAFYREHAHGDSTDLVRVPAQMGVEERIGFLFDLKGDHRKQWISLMDGASQRDLETIAQTLGYRDPISPSMPANADRTRVLLYHDFAETVAKGDPSEVEEFVKRARSSLQRLDQSDVDNQ